MPVCYCLCPSVPLTTCQECNNFASIKGKPYVDRTGVLGSYHRCEQGTAPTSHTYSILICPSPAKSTNMFDRKVCPVVMFIQFRSVVRASTLHICRMCIILRVVSFFPLVVGQSQPKYLYKVMITTHPRVFGPSIGIIWTPNFSLTTAQSPTRNPQPTVIHILSHRRVSYTKGRGQFVK